MKIRREIIPLLNSSWDKHFLGCTCSEASCVSQVCGLCRSCPAWVRDDLVKQVHWFLDLSDLEEQHQAVEDDQLPHAEPPTLQQQCSC